MEKDIVFLNNNEPRVSTADIYKELGYYEHRQLRKVIIIHEDELKKYGLLHLQVTKPQRGSKGGRPEKSYLLNENQFILLVVLCKNTPQVVEFKVKIVNQFVKLKKILSELLTRQKNQEWIELRNSGKLTRIAETDTIKKFIEYAVSQGSENAQKYYVTLTKMEYKALFLIEQKFPNIRNILAGCQLLTIGTADQIVSQALKEGMEMKMDYKEIYVLAKERVETMAKLIPRTPVPMSEKVALNEK